MSEDVKEMREQEMAVPMAGGTMPKESDEERLTRLAGEINAIKEQTRATVQNATLEIGRRLIQAKAAVPHGSWAYWLKTSVDYSERTAQMLMSTYERFGNTQQKLFGAKMDPEVVSQLNRSQMFALLSIKSEEECAEFMEEAEREIKSLRAKIAELEEKQGRESVSLDFKCHFENMKGEFNAMNEALTSMEPDQRERYRAAMKKMMDMMLQIVDCGAMA